MTIYLASDHAGYALKEAVKKFLIEQGYAIEDCGAFSFDQNDDYPDFIKKAAGAVSKNPESRGDLSRACRGILFGKAGQGGRKVANRYKGVRAVVYYGSEIEIIKLSREHNDANMLSIGAWFVKEKEALKAIKLWLETVFSGETRHQRRIDKIG